MTAETITKLIQLLKRSRAEMGHLRLTPGVSEHENSNEGFADYMRRYVLEQDIWDAIKEYDFYQQYQMGRHD